MSEIYSIKIDCATSFPADSGMLRRGIAARITTQSTPKHTIVQGISSRAIWAV
jgi:hypothetical protein